jgi:hypothetical protein
MPRPVAGPDQSEPGNGVARLQYAAGKFVECMALAAERPRVSETGIIGTALARKK